MELKVCEAFDSGPRLTYPSWVSLPCFLKCNPGTLSEPLFCKKGTYQNSCTSPVRQPLYASAGAWGVCQTPDPLPCMLLRSSLISEDFLFWGLNFLCSCFECSFLFYLFAH